MIEIEANPVTKSSEDPNQGYGCAISLLAIISAFLLVSWLGMILWASLMFGSVARSMASREYPTCPGVVTGFGQDVDSDAFEIHYEYEVDGNKYEYSTGRDPRDYPQSQASDWDSNQLKSGAQVTVYYNSNEPGESRLVPGILPEDWMFLLSTPLWVILLVITWRYCRWIFGIFRRLQNSSSQ